MTDPSFSLAVVSTLLYASLAGVSTYYYFKFKFKRSNESGGDGLLWGGLSLRSANMARFDEQKILFFLVLAVSASLDIPLFVACAAEGGPSQCEWDGVVYSLCWCLHLAATCGYMLSIILPAVLWHDIINRKDGKVWRSKYPVDCTKRFFQGIHPCTPYIPCSPYTPIPLIPPIPHSLFI